MPLSVPQRCAARRAEMAPSIMLAVACALFAVLAAAGAAAQRSGNMAYLPPIPTLPHLAKPGERHLEPPDASNISNLTISGARSARKAKCVYAFPDACCAQSRLRFICCTGGLLDRLASSTGTPPSLHGSRARPRPAMPCSHRSVRLVRQSLSALCSRS
jgi:hypothetical protein